MRIEVIAEGVEEKAQVDFLESHHCYLIQGFYFYKPMPAEDFTSILDQNGQKDQGLKLIDN